MTFSLYFELPHASLDVCLWTCQKSQINKAKGGLAFFMFYPLWHERRQLE